MWQAKAKPGKQIKHKQKLFQARASQSYLVNGNSENDFNSFQTVGKQFSIL